MPRARCPVSSVVHRPFSRCLRLGRDFASVRGHAPIAQWIERCPPKAEVARSNRAGCASLRQEATAGRPSALAWRRLAAVAPWRRWTPRAQRPIFATFPRLPFHPQIGMANDLRLHPSQRQRSGRMYTGHTNDLRTRLRDHNSGRSVHTARARPWRLVTYLAFDDERRAVQFERYLVWLRPSVCQQTLAMTARVKPPAAELLFRRSGRRERRGRRSCPWLRRRGLLSLLRSQTPAPR